MRIAKTPGRKTSFEFRVSSFGFTRLSFRLAAGFWLRGAARRAFDRLPLPMLISDSEWVAVSTVTP